MRISFVMGPPCSGKSHFIKEAFPDAKVVDLWDFQKDENPLTLVKVHESYDKAREALIKALKQSRDEDHIVLEHTLLRRKWRKHYLEAVREVTQENVNCYVLVPEMKEFDENCEKRDMYSNVERYAFDILEIPSVDEGFANIYRIVRR